MPIAVSGTDRLADAIVAIQDYAVGDNAAELNRSRLALTARLAVHAQRIRLYGSAALDLAWLAHRRVDAVVFLSNSPWDTAAGVAIAREAGAVVVDMDGSPHTLQSRATIAAPPALIPQILELLDEVASDDEVASR
jgi:myo-inositol-1(or 4)-monophosphatase